LADLWFWMRGREVSSAGWWLVAVTGDSLSVRRGP